MADGSIHIDTHLDDSGLKAGIAKMKGTITSGFGALGSIAAKGLAAATAATVTFVGAATKAGIEFESAFAGVKKTVDATDEELARLRTGILDMSKEIPLAATEIAGIAEAAGQLGIKTESILGFTEVMANLGVATNMSAEEAATALARLANITGMPQDQFDRLGSTVVALGNNFATTESEIVDMALRLAGAGKQVGLSEHQILGFSAALSSVGIQAEMGGSAFSRVFKMMQLAVERQSDELDAFAKVAGMSASEFKRAFEQDAASAMVSFVAGLGNAEQHGMSAIAVLDEMAGIGDLSAISTVAVSDALLRAAGSADMMADSLGVASTAWQENTALTNEAAQRYETLESKIQILKNTANAFMVTISDSWRETCAEFVSAGTQMIASLDAAFQSGGVEGLIAALGPALEQAVSLILSYVPRFMEVAVRLLSGLAQGILNNLPLLTQTAVQVITQLVTGFVNGLPQIASVGIQILGILAQGIVSALPQLTSVAVQAINNFANSIQTGESRVSQSGTSIIRVLLSAIGNSLSQLFAAGVNLIDRLAQGIASHMPSVVEKTGQILLSITSTVSSKLPQIVQSGVSIITSIVHGIGQMLPQILQSATQIIAKLVEGIGKSLPSVLKSAIEVVKQFAVGIFNNAGSLIDSGIQLLQKLIDGVISAIPKLLAALPQVISSAVNFFVTNAPKLIVCGVELIVQLIGGILGAIPKLLAALPQVAKALVEGLWNGIKNLGGWLKEKVSGFFGDVVGWVKGIFGIHSPSTVFAGIGGNIVEGTYKGIEAKRSSFTSRVKSFFSDIVGNVKSALGIHSPSALFRDVIGKNIGLGVQVGIEKTQPNVSKAMNDLVDPEKATSRVSKMRTSVRDHVAGMTYSATVDAAKATAPASSADYPSADAIADAIWDKAPPIEVDLDGEKVGTMIEPKVSKIQAKKTENMNRRNGLVTT